MSKSNLSRFSSIEFSHQMTNTTTKPNIIIQVRIATLSNNIMIFNTLRTKSKIHNIPLLFHFKQSRGVFGYQDIRKVIGFDSSQHLLKSRTINSRTRNGTINVDMVFINYPTIFYCFLFAHFNLSFDRGGFF